MYMKKGQMLSNMLEIATIAHSGQFDRGGKPYILHPLKVMHYLKTDDEELQCIALGHDLIEDTDVTYDYLRSCGMSERILEGICALTKVDGETYEDYQNRVMMNYDAMLVKRCDLRHNTDIRRLKGVSEKDIKRVEKYHKFYIDIETRLINIEKCNV